MFNIRTKIKLYTNLLIIGLLLISNSTVLKAQSDTSKIYNTKNFKRGFYKNYNEYIHNSPSIIYDFDVSYKYVSKVDSTIVGADYDLFYDSLHTGKIWGFCDGSNIFIRVQLGFLYERFAKVVYVGKVPFYYFSLPKGFGVGAGFVRLATLAIEKLSPEYYELFARDENNKEYKINSRLMKKLLSNNTTLLENFIKELKEIEHSNPYNTISTRRFDLYKAYLIKLNEALLASK